MTLKNGTCWYLPHFPVVREDKQTTKVRFVMDAAFQVGGRCLNTEMLPGPKLQNDVMDLLLRFRRRPVALVGDINEMFSQIRLAETDRCFHRFLWRKMECEREPDVYESTRLIFGARASPFLAQKVLLHHAEREEATFPLAAKIIKEETYVDDVMTCLETEEEAKQAREELTQMLAKGGFSIRRWCSNRLAPLDGVPEEDKVTINQNTSGLPTTKILGIQWDAQDDQFVYNISSPKKIVYTKRGVLSKVCTIFDPIGFLAPFTIRAKIGIQLCWQEGIGWDEAMPADLEESWRGWFQEVEELSQLSMPRCLRQDRRDIADVALHTFTDASEKAFGAVTYIRYVFSDGSVAVTFVAAKTRVAPLSATSIPRLELMGAHVGLRLSQKVATALQIPVQKHHFWTDSMNVLSWIKSESRQFKPFVANRVACIQQDTCPSQWRHVPGKQNPADDASRGLSAIELTSDSRWFTGPEFLHQDPDSWPERPLVVSMPEADKERRKLKIVFPAQQHQTVLDDNRFSSLKRLLRITAWVIRFASNCRSARQDRQSGTLTAEELQAAERYWIKVTQQRVFHKEMTDLQNHRDIERSSSIISLTPQLSEGGLLRVTGRLHNADIADDAKYPLILPQKSHFTELVIQDTHERLRHAGINHVLAETRQRFWIVNGRQAVKSWDFRCTYCRRRRASPGEQVMAPLPDCRLGNEMRAFACCGVDFAGPYLTKLTSRTMAKRYLCLFTCMATRAVHLEMAADLTADAFLLAFSRMVARRGKPRLVVSDNGKNFLGAKMELRRIEDAAPEIACKLGQQGVVWKLNPPSAPHHGGVFESMIKSAKKALNVILAKASVTDDELSTAFTEVEGILNSRPLTYCGADPKDEPCLTPNHFLIGQMSGSLAPQMTAQSAQVLRRRWRHLQQLVSRIWKRFQRELLPTLSQRHKWQEVKKDVEVGDVMLLLEPNTPRGKWPLVVVDAVHAGKDGHVRVVDVRRNGQVLRRPITKLCPLDCNSGRS